MEYVIRKATKTDMSQVLNLIKELAVFEQEPAAVEVTVRDLQEDGFGATPSFYCYVAQVNDKIEGIALIYNRYSTWKGKAIHLEDLIVSKPMRGFGLGKALLDEVIKHAHKLGVKRVNWEVLDWNDHAIKFYEKNGAKVMRDWNVVQLNEQGIKNYIANL